MKRLLQLTMLLVGMGLLAGCFALQEVEESSGQVAVPTVASVAGDGRLYTIDPAQSEARFILNEVLNNQDTVVQGVTNNLGGQISLDLANPATAELSAIVVNSRDIVTDNQFRNRAIANRILQSGAYEFITFTPTQVVGLPATAVVGQTYTFQINGDLTITDQTLPVTFAATVTVVSAGELRGLATTTVRHADFALEIPFSQSVQAVDEEVVLEIEFVALAEAN
jgi:polyisoprenoid-binding protein YceI